MEDTQFNLIIGAYTIDRILARLSKPDMMVCQKTCDYKHWRLMRKPGPFRDSWSETPWPMAQIAASGHGRDTG